MNSQPTPDAAPYPVGKLPQNVLIEMLTHKLSGTDPRVILGPGLGRDAAVIDFGERCLVTKTDPITFASDEIGWYAVHVNANDVACLGAKPRWFIATLMLPERQTTKALVAEIFEQMHAACRDIGATVVGGHTEITHGLSRPIVVGAMFAEVSPARLVRSDGARPGDVLLLTKGIAVEGTALLAREAPDRLQSAVAEEVLTEAARFLHAPGISVVRDALVAADTGAVHAMHDPTEGGVATGIHEMMGAAGVGAEIAASALPIYPETEAICAALGLDPLGLIASGSLLAAVAPEHAERVIAALQDEGIAAANIGTITAASDVILRSSEGARPLPTFERDEIARVFETP